MHQQPEQELLIKEAKIHKAALQIRAVRHKLRHKILQMLHENKHLTVTEVYTKLKLEQSVASQHLAILRQANVVKTNRVGKSVFYSVNYKGLDELYNTSLKLLSHS